MTEQTHARLNLSATLASVGVAIVLSLAKLWALGETGSLAVAASLADSGLDLMMSLAGLAAVIYAARPPDEDHAFGHTSAEDLAALGQSLFILISATVIAVAAVLRLLSGNTTHIAAEGRGIAVMVLSIVLTLGLVIWQRRVMIRTGSRVVEADRLHYLGDLVPAIGAIFSLWAAAKFGLTQIDAIVALAAAGMLAFGALRIGSAAWDALMDRAADPALIAEISDMVRTWPGVDGFHDLKTRRAGSRVFVTLHVELNGDLPLYDAHAIGAALRQRIMDTYPSTDVMIHKDPTGDPGPDIR
ncbi:cation diffusion facilitator family transporter [Pseudoruegeria sp. SK021]|uniref:cation diffusion facilitator family transporter n=1 Tax=Pseudoruegeria sp. SK021 TaxID=1933035 RepID=UPI000A22272C|nr:cation diffusion facilitator family transporter [Pseudoruegeria sp. SK021]OSP56057.1 cation-efflux pump [Pseudoruegeria sp. SK021]